MTRDQTRQAQERVVRRLLANGWEIADHLPALGVVCMIRPTITSDGALGKQHKTIGPRGQTTDMLDKGASCPGDEALANGATYPSQREKT
jgi:hypothetical protein